jgi:hypothetical protein
VATASDSCDSDFDCGIGRTCVKRNYSFQGTCMRSVNRYGIQQFDTPRSDSVGPKLPNASDCKVDTECPIGFRCDWRSGVCFR